MSGEKISVVMYFDGGSHVNEGLAGYGVHGYSYTNDLPKQGSGNGKAILTKNGYVNKDTTQEIAFPQVTPIDYYDLFGSVLKDGTNNVGELKGCLAALELILRYLSDAEEVLLLGDSKYVLDGIAKWSPNWIKNNWMKSDGLPVANKEIWIELLDKKRQVEEAGIKLTFAWVEGHSGNVGNDQADNLATIGLIHASKEMEVETYEIKGAKGYWTHNFDYNRMIDKSSWYFNSYHPNSLHVDDSIKPDGRYVYHLGDHGPDDDDHGKAISDSSMSVVYLKEPVPELELIRGFQNGLNLRGFKTLVIGKLTRILNAKTAYYFSRFKTDILIAAKRTRNILLSKTMLTNERDPAQLSYRAVEQSNMLEQILDDFLDDPVKHKLSVTELTHLFYSTEIKGKKEVNKLLPSITSSVKKINVLAKYDTLTDSGEIDVPLLIGVDTPSRNALAALAERVPNVYIVTWRDSDISFRYATIVKAGDDVGIWAGVYSNLRLMTSKLK